MEVSLDWLKQFGLDVLQEAEFFKRISYLNKFLGYFIGLRELDNIKESNEWNN